jgi:hypothetical protein
MVSKHAHDHIVNPPPNRKNPGEWCKREECWDQFRKADIRVLSGLEAELVDTGRPASARRNAPASEQVATDPEIVKAIARVTEVPGQTWFKISHWAKETDNLQPWQRGLSFSLGRMAGRKPPSAKQAVQAIKILEEAERRGFRSET